MLHKSNCLTEDQILPPYKSTKLPQLEADTDWRLFLQVRNQYMLNKGQFTLSPEVQSEMEVTKSNTIKVLEGKAALG